MKFQRQARILDLIEKQEIETQEELSEQLKMLGYATTQATVSRDIKELRLIKILSTTTGKYRYAAASTEVENSFSNRLKNIFKECVTSIASAQNTVVIKTLPGLGQAAAMAIDAMRDYRVVGTLGGDDTVFVVMKDNDSATEFCIHTQNLLK